MSTSRAFLVPPLSALALLAAVFCAPVAAAEPDCANVVEHPADCSTYDNLPTPPAPLPSIFGPGWGYGWGWGWGGPGFQGDFG